MQALAQGMSVDERLQLRHMHSQLMNRCHEAAEDVSEEKSPVVETLVMPWADIPLELLAKAGPAYSEKQREFALTLHLHGPKAYSYLSDVKHIPLPHPHTLQSRSPMGKGYKAPLSADNWEDTLSFFKEAKDYLLSMAREDGTPLFRTKRYLSIMGFIINIETLSLMVPKLLHTQRYVLTYRFSQDHLELLFNSIRASGERKTRERGRKRRVEIGREREMQP
uniref:uncharacterized protein isoform X2 n=1 Tax=Myxine glutinosa TaxID=7769 RepID=UPI00358E133B